MDVDQLEAITDTKDGHTKLEDGQVIVRSICIVDAVWAPRDNDSTADKWSTNWRLPKYDVMKPHTAYQ